MMKPYHILLSFFLYATVHSDTFSSLQHLLLASQAENAYYTTVDKYIATRREELVELEQLTARYRDINAELYVDPERHLSHPVNAYLTIKQMNGRIYDINKLLHPPNDTAADQLFAELDQELYEWKSSLPDNEDVDGAIRSLLRIQDTYDLKTKQLSDGLLNATAEAPPLSAEECFQIGAVAFNNQDYYHSVNWFSEALNKFDMLPFSENIKNRIANTLNYLNFALFKQDNIERALKVVKRWLSIEPGAHPGVDNMNYYQQVLQEGNKEYNPYDLPPLKNERIRNGYHNTDDFRRYEYLCQGRELPVELNPNTEKRPLNCYNKFSPVHLYAPIKVEQLNLNPSLVFFHDVLTDSEIQEIQNVAIPKLQRSGVFNKGGLTPEGGVKTETRVSKSAWVYDSESEIITHMSKKISRFANLNLETAEALQVLNYGIGGHYEPHIDFARSDNPNVFGESQGNRIATFILYLSDVERGGATAFPRLGRAVWPERGGAAFWYNLHKSGVGDERTLHGACPVLIGYKWVCNKWFHEGNNDMNRPCDLNDDSFGIY